MVIPDSVTSIRSYAFYYCSSLTSVVIPDSVTYIGSGTFESCNSLTSVVIPDSVTYIGSRAFYRCNKLTIFGEKNSYAQTYAKSNNIPFKVINAEITKQPKYQTFHELGETINFSVSANNAASYQWYYSKDGDNWYKCTTEGSATDTLSITVTSSNATRLYRCKVTGDNGKSVTSEAAGLIGFIKQPADVNAAYRDQVTFSVTGVHSTDYQWYYSKDGSSWFKSTATGNDTDSITFKVTSTNAGHQYRCVITGINGKKLTSDSAEINIYPGAVIVKQPSYQPATGLGENVTFKVSAKRAASYQWYYSSNGGTSWNRCTTEGSNSNALSVTVTSTTVKRLYRCKVTGKDGKTVTTEQAGIIAILSNPKDVTGSRGDVITFTVQASNAESYQWYFSKDGTSWYKSTATGNTSDTLSLKLSRSNASNMYRCVVTGPDGKKVKSNIAKIETMSGAFS